MSNKSDKPDPIATHRLVAILFADIEGYTALMQDQESHALAILNRFQQVVKAEVDAYRGKLVKSYGDGSLILFQSTLDAVHCAAQMQKAFRREPSVPLRIGIHIGEVISTHEDYFGHGINLASRIESMGIAGSVLFSSAVAKTLENHPEFTCVSLGCFEFKNVKDPIEVFALANPGFPKPDQAGLKGKFKEGRSPRIASENSIMVLPFRNLNADPESEYFSDGLTEDLIIALGKIRELKVVGPNSSFSLKQQKLSIKEIGNTFHVNFILEGSVRKADNRLRITAELIDLSTGYQLWSERFDRNLNAIFDIQDEISLAIAEQLKIHLAGVEKAAVITHPTQNLKAYELYLKGRYYWKQRGQSLMQALRYFEEAVQADPRYALAFAGLADCYTFIIIYALDAPEVWIPKGRAAAARALQLDPDLPEAHSANGLSNLAYEWNWEKAKFHCRKAIELNPANVPALLAYSLYLSWVEGRFDEGLWYTDQAFHRDPQDYLTYYYYSTHYLLKRDYEKTFIWGKKSTELAPGFFTGYRQMGLALLGMERYKEAADYFEMAVKLSNRHCWPLSEWSYACALAGQKQKAEQLLIELLTLAQRRYIANSFLSFPYIALNRFDEALNALEKAFEQKEIFLLVIKYLPIIFQPLYQEPRFNELIEKIGYPNRN